MSRSRRFGFALAVTLALAALAGCRRREPEGPGPRPLRVEVAGCAIILRGAACELSADRALRVWVELPEGEPLVAIAGSARLESGWKQVQGGRLGALRVPEGVSEVVVRAGLDEAARTWRLSLREPSSIPLLEEARRQRTSGQTREAARLLQEGAQALGEAEQARVLSFLGRLKLSLGQPEEAASVLREAIALHRRLGQRTSEASDSFALSYLLIQDRHFAQARAELEALGPLEEDCPEGAVQRPYYQGLLAFQSGDVRSALRAFGEAELGAERLGMERQLRAVRQALATALQFLGRDTEALAVVESLGRGSPEASPCERADLLTNLGWSLLRAKEATGAAPARDPVPILEEALALQRQGCPWLAKEANILVNLALAELQAGRAERARDRLRAARAVQAEPGASLALWWLDIEARIELGAGRPRQALQLFARLSALAETSLSPEARWRAALGRARALEQLGEKRSALEAYARAEALLDEEVLRVPVAEGRHSLLRDRERGTQAYVALAVHMGRVREAMETARRARIRVLEGVRLADRVAQLSPDRRAHWEKVISAWREEREALDREAAQDWRLSAERLAMARRSRQPRMARLRALLDEALLALGPTASRRRPLPPPEPDELQLVYYPIPRGWMGFAVDARGVTARLLEPVNLEASPATLAAVLLEPFRERILAARRLTFIPYGALRVVDFHALPLEGESLLASRPVAYALDLPRPATVTRAQGGQALVVADPQGNLPMAREEARHVRGSVEGRAGWQVLFLSGGAAEGQKVRAALEEASLFHYAGHGRFAGLGGWDSVLPLSGGQLTVGDVLALRGVPDLVVLSGCETARAALESPVESMGLAQAFLAAGARGVVASWREVADADALELMRILYQHADLEDPRQLPIALQRAQLWLRAQRPRSDWAAFRALVP